MLYASADLSEDHGGEKKLIEEDVGSDKVRARMNDKELLGSMYVFLLAGRDTSPNTLAFVFTLLALHQDKQQKLYDHITSIVPAGSDPSYDDFYKFTYLHALVYESLRLFPASVVIPKYAVANHIVPTSPLPDGTPGQPLFIPRWTELFLNVVTLHRSKRYWGEDANEFKPERFIDSPEVDRYKWPREAFLGFSGGHRVCLGQKFATITATITVSTILRKYSVHLEEDLNGTSPAGETFAEKVERVTDCTSFIALALKKSKLVFRERKV